MTRQNWVYRQPRQLRASYDPECQKAEHSDEPESDQQVARGPRLHLPVLDDRVRRAFEAAIHHGR